METQDLEDDFCKKSFQQPAGNALTEMHDVMKAQNEYEQDALTGNVKVILKVSLNCYLHDLSKWFAMILVSCEYGKSTCQSLEMFLIR